MLPVPWSSQEHDVAAHFTLLQVLRDHRETLMSVMETFVHDPLVEWTHGHRSGDELDNPHAKDALATINGM
jgi:phosphatidylinositol kinase/protein kinase (PI-3  family)